MNYFKPGQKVRHHSTPEIMEVVSTKIVGTTKRFSNGAGIMRISERTTCSYVLNGKKQEARFLSSELKVVDEQNKSEDGNDEQWG